MIRKGIFISLLVLIGTQVFAQVKDNALGIRLGGSNSYGAEISYQRGFSSTNRGEFDLGLRSRDTYSAFALTGIYQWVWPIEDGFKWYAGPGLQIGSWGYTDDNKHDNDGGTWFAFMGQIGIEYQFNIPLQISLDLRPGIAFGDAYDDIIDLGLGIRYTFK